MRLLKSGKGNEAEELLGKAIEECGYSESDYYLAIILAEILIFKVCHSLLTPGEDKSFSTLQIWNILIPYTILQLLKLSNNFLLGNEG